jgi:hypothetical protein
MTDFFISYARKDGSEFAHKLHDALEADKASNYDAWLDSRDILGSSHWDDSIENALRECKALLLVMTPGSSASQNCKDEWSYAIELKKAIIPLLVIDTDTPFRLKRIQRIDFRENFARGMAELRQTIAELQKKTLN